jgi:hypothetical protein
MRRSSLMQRENSHAGLVPSMHPTSALLTPSKQDPHNATSTSPIWKTPSESDKYAAKGTDDGRPLVYYEASAGVETQTHASRRQPSHETNHTLQQDSYGHLSSNSGGNSSLRGGPFSSTSSMLTSHLSSSSTHSLHGASIPAHTSPPLSFLHAHAHAHYSSSSSMDDRMYPSESVRVHATTTETRRQPQSDEGLLRGGTTLLKSPVFVNSQTDGHHVDATAVDNTDERRTPHSVMDNCEIFENGPYCESNMNVPRMSSASSGHHINNGMNMHHNNISQINSDSSHTNGQYTGQNSSSNHNGVQTSARMGRSSAASKRAPKSLPPALTVIEDSYGDGYGGADEEIFSPKGTERTYVPDAAGVGIHSSGEHHHRDEDDIVVQIASPDDVCVNVAPSTPSQVRSVCSCV